VWWISYRGEGKAGVENIGVFEDDGTPRKKHTLLLDPSPDAYPLHIARSATISTLPTPGARTAMSPGTAATVTVSTSPR
jgi:hypothetical protein